MAVPNTDRVLSFEVYRGPTLVKTEKFERESVTIGSGKAALLSIPEKSLADLHAVVNVDDAGRVHVLDLGSDAGTKVNGETVSNKELATGDAIEMGDVRVVVKLEDGTPDAPDEEATVIAGPPKAASTPAPAMDAPPTPVALAARTPQGVPPAPAASTAAAPVAAAATAAEALTDPGDVPTTVEDEVADIDDDEEQEPVEDVMAFILRSGSSTSGLGIEKKRPKVLEVSQAWENTLLDTKHFPKGGKPITVGSSVGWRWQFLDVNMGWVVPPLNTLLRYTPPMWSDVVADWRNDFYAPDDEFAGRDHQLAEWDGEHYVLRVRKGWDGFVDIGSERHSFEDLLASGKASREDDSILVPITDDSRAMVDVGGIVFFTQMVYPGKRVLARMSDEVDYPFLAVFSLVGFIGLMFGVLMFTLPPPPSNEMVEIPDRFAKVLFQKPEEKQEHKKPGGNPDAGEGARAKREEGKVGKKDATMDKAKGNKVEIQKQERDRQIAENAGVLGADLGGSELEGVFGSAAVDSSLMGGIGGATGAKGVQRGSGGLGSRGSGLGGGGTAEGLGGLGTKGTGSGASGYGQGGGNFGAKGEGAIGTVGGDPIILGALDRSLIDEVVKRHIAQIRYCYQRELTKNPTLSGKIVIKFVIAKDGSVSSASKKTSTMHNSAVESCVAGRFLRMQFPQPKGGGIVFVSYPFLFSPG